tara:strand:+ start:2877 stop:3431 length:555 start_codon:yes stop_codon:yes gene_type:complete
MKKSQIKPIQGSTILLNPFSKEFVSKDYLNWMNDAETTRFIQKAKNNTSIDELYSFANEMINSEKDYFFAIFLKKNQLHIGNVRLGPIDFNLMKSNFGIMIGNKEFRGCGVGVEVLELIKDFSFNHLKLEQLIFPAVEEYTAAMRLYEKTGFTLNNKVKKTLNKNGKSWKLVEWSMNNPFKYKN